MGANDRTVRIAFAAATLALAATLAQPAKASSQSTATSGNLAVSTALRAVFDSNIDHDQDNHDAAGAVFENEVRWWASRGRSGVEAEYRIGIHRYTRDDPWNRVSHELETAYDRSLSGRWTLGLAAEMRLNGSSEDRDVSDSYVVGPRIAWQPSDQWRVRLSPAYRYRSFEDRDYDYAHQPYVEAEIRRELADGARWNLATRYDTRRTPTAEDRYHRWRQQVELEYPLRDRDELNIGAEYRYRWYPEREVETTEGETERRDHQWEASIEWVHHLRKDLDLAAGYEFDARSSNEADEDFTAHRVKIGIEADWPF